MQLRIAVLGAGSWGTTVAALASHNAPVALWARRDELAEYRGRLSGPPGPPELPQFGAEGPLPERFTADRHWMSECVLIAKHTLVWLYQLSQRYQRPIERLDQTPDEEFAELRRRGFTGLWLIGLWERSHGSGEIKRLIVSKVGNFAIDLPDASVLVQISGTYGSRQEEAQRLGRILRPKSDNGEAHFYTSSRLVKEVATLGGDVEGLVPQPVLNRLRAKTQR